MILSVHLQIKSILNCFFTEWFVENPAANHLLPLPQPVICQPVPAHHRCDKFLVTLRCVDTSHILHRCWHYGSFERRPSKELLETRYATLRCRNISITSPPGPPLALEKFAPNQTCKYAACWDTRIFLMRWVLSQKCSLIQFTELKVETKTKDKSLLCIVLWFIR